MVKICFPMLPVLSAVLKRLCTVLHYFQGCAQHLVSQLSISNIRLIASWNLVVKNKGYGV